MSNDTEDVLRAWKAAADQLPPGWSLDGIRCTSTGLAPGERGDRWRAVAVGADGASLEATADDPQGALDELLARFAQRGLARTTPGPT